MTIGVTPGDGAIYQALVAFLGTILPSGMPVIQGQQNRAAEPAEGDFAVIWQIARKRLATNTDSWADAKFMGSIAGATLTISRVDAGRIVQGSPLFGVDVKAGTSVDSFLSGRGGVGTYKISPAQIVASCIISAGTKRAAEPVEVTVQIDVHGPASADNAQRISTLLRDESATSFFAENAPGISPLHADDPRQIPFINENQQYEWRWSVDACLQADLVVSGIPQQFADRAEVSLVSVDAAYPPE